jgi:DNA/RNA-binding domain of Phe-tRNA-synthetase-like protein
MALTIAIDPHPLLEVAAFVTRAPRPIAELADAPSVPQLGRPGATAPLASSDGIRAAVRDLLRASGFRPSGRSKPSPEYLAGAYAEGRFPRINPLVDLCNVVSLHAALPISLVDAAKLSGPLVIRVAPPGTSYAFNPAGQVLEAAGLLCLWDTSGPSGSPVKDAQRTKTDGSTRVALSVVWGTRALPGRASEAARWYRALTEELAGAGDPRPLTEPVELVTASSPG